MRFAVRARFYLMALWSISAARTRCRGLHPPFDGIRLLHRPCIGPRGSLGDCDWQEYSDVKMFRKRWYPSSVTLPDGTIFVAGGINYIGDLSNLINEWNWEIYPRPRCGPSYGNLPFLRATVPNQLYLS